MDLLQPITKKKQRLDCYHPFPPELVNNLDAWYRVELTYTSNALEGNTLSRQETALVVEKGLTIEGKTLVEHLEATNHAHAWELVKGLLTVKNRRQDIEESDMLDMHRVILTGIDDAHAGRYRTVAVRIAGANVVLPNPHKVPELMKDFITWLHDADTGHAVTVAADAHFKLVSIHPFIDGNGRTARLLMNWLLMQGGYPPAMIRPEDRRLYVNALEKGQTGGAMDDYYQVIYDAVERSLDIYLNALEESRDS